MERPELSLLLNPGPPKKIKNSKKPIDKSKNPCYNKGTKGKERYKKMTDYPNLLDYFFDTSVWDDVDPAEWEDPFVPLSDDEAAALYAQYLAFVED